VDSIVTHATLARALIADAADDNDTRTDTRTDT